MSIMTARVTAGRRTWRFRLVDNGRAIAGSRRQPPALRPPGQPRLRGAAAAH